VSTLDEREIEPMRHLILIAGLLVVVAGFYAGFEYAKAASLRSLEREAALTCAGREDGRACQVVRERLHIERVRRGY
jgi:hypothetical protein